MAGFIRYEQAPVTMAIGGGAGCELLATTVTAGENLPLTAVRALGYNGAVAVTSNGPVDGSFSVTYHMVKEKMPAASCRTSADVPGGCTNFFAPVDADDSDFVMSRSFANSLSMTVAGTTLFTDGIANSFTVTAEPNAIITATLAGNYFDCRMAPNGGALAVAPIKVGGGDFAVAHGSTSGAEGDTSGLGFSCDPFTATYESSRGFNPIYSLGKLSAIMVMITDPQQSITMQGENIPKSVLKNSGSGTSTDCASLTDALCLEKSDIGFNLKDVCNNSIGVYNVCGFVASRDIEVAENDVLRGNITITDYTFPQEVDSVDCE